MQESKEPGIREVFVIKTNQIDFLGVMVGHDRDRSAVQGRVTFPDGARWSFQSPPGDHAGVRNQMISLCREVAAWYRADIVHLAFPRLIGYEEFIGVLRESQRHIGYA